MRVRRRGQPFNLRAALALGGLMQPGMLLDSLDTAEAVVQIAHELDLPQAKMQVARYIWTLQPRFWRGSTLWQW